MLRAFLVPVFCFCSLFASQERTLSIIKPEAVAEGHVQEILSYFETTDLEVVASKEIQLTPEQARDFYAEHKGRPFFEDLVQYMSSGPVIVQILEGEDAVAVNRQLMGATDPKRASPGTIRADFGTSLQKNAVHGSDSVESATREISFFFPQAE